MNKKSSEALNPSVNLLFIILTVAALLFGGFVYILWRSSEPVFFNWMDALGLDGWLNHVRIHSVSVSRFLPEWFIYSLPNGLWAFAFALCIATTWRNSKSRIKYFWMGAITLLVPGFEILQYFQVIPGTFCFQDLLFGSIGLITGIFIGTKSIKNYSHEKKNI